MMKPIRTAVAWVTLAQVVLVGAVGTGLHGLFGCEHGPCHGCTEMCCTTDGCSIPPESSALSGCEDCVFCRRAAERGRTSSRHSETPHGPATQVVASVRATGCDGCILCDLLDEYQNVTPWALGPLAIELASGEASIQQQNAIIASATRLAFSRGPPAV